MKKYLTGMIAVTIAVLLVAFTNIKSKTGDDAYVFSSPDGSSLHFEGINVPLPDGCPDTPDDILCGRIYALEDVEVVSEDPLVYRVIPGHEDDWLDEFYKPDNSHK